MVAEKIVACLRWRVVFWLVIKESSLFYAGFGRRKDGEKVESRVKHVATRMTR